MCRIHITVLFNSGSFSYLSSLQYKRLGERYLEYELKVYAEEYTIFNIGWYMIQISQPFEIVSLKIRFSYFFIPYLFNNSSFDWSLHNFPHQISITNCTNTMYHGRDRLKLHNFSNLLSIRKTYIHTCIGCFLYFLQ